MAEIGEAAALHGATRADDRHPVAQCLDLGQDMAGEEHGASLLPLLLDALAEDGVHQRVEALGRLVQDQQLDVRRQRRDRATFCRLPFE